MTTKTGRTQVGVDAGGTWVRAALRREGHEPLRRARRKITRLSSLKNILRSIFSSWNLLKVDRLVVGSRGVWHPQDRLRLAQELASLAREVRVLSDMELAWQACLGGRPGILVVSGTGSAVYGKDSCGHSLRAGGWGPLLGDEGSAFWIGKQWLIQQPESKILRYAHHPHVVRAVSALAREVLRKSPTDTRAQAILKKASEELVRLTTAVASQLHFSERISVSWSGGMFKNPDFTALFIRNLRRMDPRMQPQTPLCRPEETAAGRQNIF